jgi:uncharacterized protein (TIGR02099 family)
MSPRIGMRCVAYATLPREAMDAASPLKMPSAVSGWRVAFGRLLATIEWLAWAAFFVAAVTFIALRYAVLPRIENYRPQIEAALSDGLGTNVSIGRIEAGWDGLYPDLDLTDVRLTDRQGRSALTLPSVSLTVSWWSVPARTLRLHALEITGADLDIRRASNGTFIIGGIEIADSGEGGGLSDWILGQRRIVIADSRLRWNDEKRGARELGLSNIRMVLENSGSRHRFGLIADPPRELASRLDVRADLHGESLTRLRAWRGNVYADLKTIDLAAWRAWVDYPVDVRSGSGSVRAWLGFDGDHLEQFTADLGLAEAQARLGRDLPELALARVSGRIALREIASGGKALGFIRLGDKQVTGFEVKGRQVALTTKAGVSLAPADFTVRTVSARGNRPQEIEMEANSLDLEPLASLLEHLPVDAQFRRTLGEYNPRGAVFDFRVSWRGDFDKPAGYSARGRFANLSMDAHGPIPGFTNLSGSVVATEKGGTLTLASRGAVFRLPEIFEDPDLDFESLTAQIGWSFPDGRMEFRTDNLAFTNQDATGTAQVVYRSEPGTAGYMDLNARVVRGNGARAVRYVPKYLAITRSWLATAIDKVRVDEGSFHLKGNLHDFPFLDPKRGSFHIALKVSDGSVLYANGWPRIDNIRGELVFDRGSMEFKSAAAGSIGQAKLGRVDLRIPELGATKPMLEIQGVADGPTQAFVQFIEQSPVDRMIDGFTDGMRATGTGRLNLKISLPLSEFDKTRITGQFQFNNNDLRLDDGLPVLAKTNGVLAFTESSLALRAIRGEALGGAFVVNGASRGDGTIGVTANGNFTVAGLRTWITEPWLAAASGGSNWRATVNVRRRGGEVVVESNLAGVGIDLPAPLGKPAAEATSLRVQKNPVPNSRGEDEFSVVLGRALTARIQRRPEGEEMRFARGSVGIGEAAPALPRTGLAFAMAARSIDADQWRALIPEAKPGTPSGAGMAGANFSPVQGSLRAESLDVLGKRFTQARVGVVQEGAAWNLSIASQEANGTVSYQPGAGRDAGRVGVRLKNLLVPANLARQEPGEGSAIDRVAQELPAVDIVIDAFEVGDKKLGKLDLVAANAGGEWRIQRLNLANPDGVLAGSGVWRARRAGEVRRRLALDFTLEAYDAGKLLDRLGFPATLKAGSGRLEGNIAWEGSPLAIDYPSLSGNVSLRVEKGQFLKAEPGVGKLLGIMSLQALPRRLTLDFRDVFSEGFAFDLVSASSRIDRGVLSTQDFKMTGVTAAVLMNGEVDLARETQGLRVVVLPDLSGGMGSVVTALLGNPILGLATYLAQRVLKDPISKAFSFEYSVGGTWADPKVVRVQNTQLGQAVDAAAQFPPPPAAVPPKAPVEEAKK